MKTRNRSSLVASVIGVALALGVGIPAMAAGTVNVGLSTGLSGAAAGLGMANRNGVELAIDDINAHGGLLGEKVRLLTADGQTKPNVGAGNIRSFILTDHAKAIFGPLTSSSGIAAAAVANQYHVPIFFTMSNDIEITGKAFSKYGFQVVPSTYMEPHAMALYAARLFEEHHWKTLYTIAPNYAFGHSTVDQFLAALKADGVHVDVVGQQWPQLGAGDFTADISAIIAKHPDFLFSAEYGGDLITFTKQAEQSGLFKKTAVLGDYWSVVLAAMGESAPAGAITDDRALPFYMAHTKAMEAYVNAYHLKFHRWPGLWSTLGYVGVQTWAEGVKKAGSFDGDKVAAALSGATVSTIEGDFKLRACDHLAEVPVYMGTLSTGVNQKYGQRTMVDVVAVPADKIMLGCSAKIAMRGGH